MSAINNHRLRAHLYTRRRVVLIGDHAIIKEGLRAVISEVAMAQVVAEFGDGSAAMDHLDGLRPDLVVIDLSEAGISDVGAIRDIRRRALEMKILVLGARQDEDYIVSALRAGANAYILKNATKEEFLTAMKCALEGKVYLNPDILSDIISVQLIDRGTVGRHSPRSSLTARERQIMTLIAEGKRSKNIANSLSISVKTVETHRTNLMKKLKLHSVAEVTAFAIRKGHSDLYVVLLTVLGCA